MKKLVVSKIGAYISLTRINKPIGTLLLLWPTLWAVWIASNGIPELKILMIFIAGVITMRSAGCVINDIADRDFDGQVARTKGRPLASGKINLKEALCLFVVLALVGLGLVLQLNTYTILLSFVGLLLAIIYPFTKRVTELPQVVLGVAFAWAVPMSFAAINNHVSKIGWLLFIIASLWPIAYDTIYALMDKQYDLNIGIKSTAILFGRYDLLIIFLIQALMLSGLLLVGYMLQLTMVFYLSLLIAFCLVGYQIWLVNQRSVPNYYRAFYNNHWMGLVIFLGISLSYL